MRVPWMELSLGDSCSSCRIVEPLSPSRPTTEPGIVPRYLGYWSGLRQDDLPISNPDRDREVAVQIQVELSGPTPGIKVGDNEVPHVSTWQWQASVTLIRGKKTVLVEAPARFEMTVDYAPTTE